MAPVTTLVSFLTSIFVCWGLCFLIVLFFPPNVFAIGLRGLVLVREENKK